MTPDAALHDRLAAARARVDDAARRSGRDPAAVTLVVVTKSAPTSVFEPLAGAGVTDIGENRAQTAAARLEGWRDRFTTHFIGHLQSNKVRRVLPLFDVFHGIDSVGLLRRMDGVAAELGLSPRLLLQVNVSGEGSKSGLAPAEVREAVELAADLRAARLVGLMTMAPRVDHPDAARPVFAQLARLRDELEQTGSGRLPELSMGMSGDFEVAIEEGATMVRLGTTIVGAPR